MTAGAKNRTRMSQSRALTIGAFLTPDTNFLNIKLSKAREMFVTNYKHFPSPPVSNFSINTDKITEKANKRLVVMKRLKSIHKKTNTCSNSLTQCNSIENMTSVLNILKADLYAWSLMEDQRFFTQNNSSSVAIYLIHTKFLHHNDDIILGVAVSCVKFQGWIRKEFQVGK